MTVYVETPPNTLLRIDQIFVYASVDREGHEGVCAVTIGGVSYPMIAADETRLKQLTPMAEDLAKRTGMRIRLLRFSTREEVRTIGPVLS